jgi:futalosine hydrolase
MKIIIVAATQLEIEPFLQTLGKPDSFVDSLFHFQKKSCVIDLLVTGVGMVATAYQLGRLFAAVKYDFAINAGICGSFNRNITVGEVVNVITDSFGDMGAEDNDSWIPLPDLKLLNADKELFTSIEIDNSPGVFSKLTGNLRPVKGVTVNTVHGNEESIRRFQNRTNADTESMEGAAFIYACSLAKTEWLQLRSISNLVEPRDRSKWDIPLAISNLNRELNKIVIGLQ